MKAVKRQKFIHTLQPRDLTKLKVRLIIWIFFKVKLHLQRNLMYIEHYFLIILESMKREIKASVLLSACIEFYRVFIKLHIENLYKTDFSIQKSSCVYTSLIDIHATTLKIQSHYTRNSSRKPTPNKYSRN